MMSPRARLKSFLGRGGWYQSTTVPQYHSTNLHDVSSGISLPPASHTRDSVNTAGWGGGKGVSAAYVCGRRGAGGSNAWREGGGLSQHFMKGGRGGHSQHCMKVRSSPTLTLTDHLASTCSLLQPHPMPPPPCPCPSPSPLTILSTQALGHPACTMARPA